VLHHAGIVDFARRQNDLWPVEPLRVVNYFPINHIGCVIDICAPVMVAGGAIIFMEQFEPNACTALMAHERATMWGSVPSVLLMPIDEPRFAEHDLAALQLIVWEGAALPAELLPRLSETCSRLASNYGMTETTSAITAIAPTSDPDILLHSVGHPLPGTSIRLDGDADGVGEVCVQSSNVMLGYWRN
jgi:acyl-CoA synthetase (AMP-forming)/AMP-acid ligase II